MKTTVKQALMIPGGGNKARQLGGGAMNGTKSVPKGIGRVNNSYVISTGLRATNKLDSGVSKNSSQSYPSKKKKCLSMFTCSPLLRIY